MSVAQLKAGTVMDKAAALLDDVTRTTYTYTVQVPYLQMAMQELQEYFELHSLSVTEKSSTVIPVDAGVTEIAYDVSPLPELPDDMIEPQQLWERNRNIDPFVPMIKGTYIIEGIQLSRFGIYLWQDQKIKLPSSNQNNDIKIDYIRALFTEIYNQDSVINIVNARSFLQFRTAGLVAEFVEHNEERATKLNSYASLAMDRATGISIKGKQNIMTRRRPFRIGYKRRVSG
jgi:hypothetical protein